jgi:hypothetical protein
MNLSQFHAALLATSAQTLELWIDERLALAQHFHVTEVGLVTKDFIDCGGVRRSDQACVLQTLVAHDTDHRLSPQKLAGILGKSTALGMDPSLPVDVELQGTSIETWRVVSMATRENTLVFALAPKQTACLAEDLCGLSVLPLVTGSGCGPTGCC